ncbi:MAG: DUF3592 domain-containing protein [Lachnospiraceae bacterium]|jgi:hypothetical protein|nr:DUF3592 domain-containing protein [Lachnospiraceae bacterium]
MDNDNSSSSSPSTDATVNSPADTTNEPSTSANKKEKIERKPSMSAGILSIIIGAVCILVTTWLLRSQEEIRLTWIDDVAVLRKTEDVGSYDSDDEWDPSWRLTLIYTSQSGEEIEFWDVSDRSFSDQIGEEIPILRTPDESQVIVRERPSKPGFGWYIAYGIGGFFVLLGLQECFKVIIKKLKSYMRGD